MEENKEEFEIRDRRKIKEEVPEKDEIPSEDVTKRNKAAPKEEKPEKEKPFKEKPLEKEEPSFMEEVNFINFITSLSTTAMINLGIIGDPADMVKGKNLETAKQLIDTIAMIEEKTRGNLDEREEKYLRDTLYHLRMAYVNLLRENKGR